MFDHLFKPISVNGMILKNRIIATPTGDDFEEKAMGGAALVIAGLATDGITIVDDIVYIQRGYEQFEKKLQGLGAMIEKVASEKEIQKFKLKVG